jgi:hypothetical protein
MLCSRSNSTPRLLLKKQEQVFPNKAGIRFPTGCKKCDAIHCSTTERLKHSPQSRARSEPPNTHNSPFPSPKATRQISGSYTPTTAPSHATQSSTQQTPTAPPKPHTCNRFVPPCALSGRTPFEIHMASSSRTALFSASIPAARPTATSYSATRIPGKRNSMNGVCRAQSAA